MAKKKDTIGVREYRLGSGEPRWRIEFRDHNGDRRMVSGFTTKTDAKDERARYKAAVSKVKRKNATPEDRELPSALDPTKKKDGETWFGFASTTFLEEYRGRWGTQPVSSYYQTIVKPTIEPFVTFGAEPMRKTTRERIEWSVRQMQRNGVSPTTIRKKLSLMQTLAEMAIERKMLDVNPVIHVKRPSLPEPAARAFTEAEWWAFHGELADGFHPDRSMAEFALAAGGARLCEGRRLRWTDVDLAGQYATFRHYKGGRERRHTVKLSEVAIEALPEPQAEGYVFTDSDGEHYDTRDRGRAASKRFERAAKRAGLSWAGFKTIRTTAATWAEEADVAVEHTQKALGHASVTTTQQFYCRSKADKTAPVVNAISKILRSKTATKSTTPHLAKAVTSDGSTP